MGNNAKIPYMIKHIRGKYTSIYLVVGLPCGQLVFKNSLYEIIDFRIFFTRVSKVGQKFNIPFRASQR